MRSGRNYFYRRYMLLTVLAVVATSSIAMSLKEGKRNRIGVSPVPELGTQKKGSSNKEVFKFMDKIDWDNEDQIRHILEIANYLIYGIPIAWFLQYIIIYAYSYFVVYTTSWIFKELNRGGDLNNPVIYHKNDLMDPLQAPEFQQFIQGFLSVANSPNNNIPHENKNEIKPVYAAQNYYQVAITSTPIPYLLSQLNGPEHGREEPTYQLYGRSLLKS
ncbi:unnamed protein product [Allacma fusca]|uniref:Uncharacterized protein n=1 Tax=Allacma fusca TaxID=39272 RepID=A0A8J2L7C4_9HEXA|nr:unnamed protein product [Allacma fusca]